MKDFLNARQDLIDQILTSKQGNLNKVIIECLLFPLFYILWRDLTNDSGG